MTDQSSKRLPAGRPPWDAWNGARIGIIAGGLLGLFVVFIAGSDQYWLGLIGCLVGGLAGYWTERRKRTGN